jgi:hypothetical protein
MARGFGSTGEPARASGSLADYSRTPVTSLTTLVICLHDLRCFNCCFLFASEWAELSRGSSFNQTKGSQHTGVEIFENLTGAGQMHDIIMMFEF